MLEEKIVEFLRDKKVLILGFGREGRSTYRLMRENLPEQVVTIADRNPIELTDKNVEVVSGENYLDNLADYDVIMKSPGVSLKDVDVSSFVDKIYSQLELFLENFAGTTIGVTGTKGKSTTSTMIYEVIKDQGLDTVLLGNIGVPIFDRLVEIKDDTTVVLELSSHQLQYVRRSPKIALITNIFPEHLDYYKTFDEYKAAKENIFKFQRTDDKFISKVKLNSDLKLKVPGEFNQLNAAYALAVANELGLDVKQACETLEKFRGLPHRLELVGEYDGVKYYDNAIATIPEATIAAIKALADVDTVIIGGMNRGVEQKKLVDFLRNDVVQNVIGLPETGWGVIDELGRGEKVQTMQEAVALAKKLTKKGKSCLLSPAAASYNAYKNFEEKGDEFKRLVRE